MDKAVCFKSLKSLDTADIVSSLGLDFLKGCTQARQASVVNLCAPYELEHKDKWAQGYYRTFNKSMWNDLY